MATISSDDVTTKGKCTKPLFRLMNLIRETQCEVEVTKPVLDELEVMRLCHSLGMMSSVDAKEFDSEILTAHDFDEDFARFLRTDLFGTNRLGDVRFKGLFGKQTQITATLAQMKVCPAEIVASLAELGEGVYCVKTGSEIANVDQNGTLVVFSWIRDELFKPQALRDTPTLVLRFLTVLTPDIICCMSASDLEQLRDGMIDSEKEQSEDLSLYSVSYCLETQQDALDGTACVASTTVDLHNILQDCSSVSFLKGNYPALALTKTMKAEIRDEAFEQTFRRNARLSFTSWLKSESEQFRIQLCRRIETSKLCEKILREFDMWPEAQVMESWKARDDRLQGKYESTCRELDDEIAKQRSAVKEIANRLFRLGPVDADTSNTSSPQDRVAEYGRFREWVQPKGRRNVDRELMSKLDIPLRIQDIKAVLFDLYLIDQDADLATVLAMCTRSTKAQLLEVVTKCRAGRQVSDEKRGCSSAGWKTFAEKIGEPLSKLQREHWLAIESSLVAWKTARLDELKRDQKRAKYEVDEATKGIIGNKFEQLCTMLESKEGPLMKVNATMRKGNVSCKGIKEVQTSSFDVQEVVKVINGDCNTAVELESLGHFKLNPQETHLALFTVKMRSAVQVCSSSEQMCINFINFPRVENATKPSPANVKLIRTLGKIASLFDFDSQTRNIAFLAEDSVAIYKFDETFKKMELIRMVDLGVHSTLTALPFTDVFVLEKSIYLTDSRGVSQSFNLTTAEISKTVEISDADPLVQSSRLMPFAEKHAVGVVCFKSQAEGTLEGTVKCVAVDDYRSLPALSLGIEFLSDTLHAQCINEGIWIVDTVAEILYLFSVDVTVKSESSRLREVDDNAGEDDESGARSTECLRKLHWLYTFYHVFEKFPVQGLLNDGERRPVSILAACPVSTNLGLVLENCHDFFSLLMSDLMALNKPLQGLNLTRGLDVLQHASLDDINMKTMSLKTFFQTLITFLPIQICRAEANALTLLQDGMSQPFDVSELELEEDSWGTAEIADSIRFGLLSPFLSAWQGTCVVITSMGKQSTGKSYFLNHLTGSSFAIAGNRCTDGAWMSVRVMKDVLLVVLDFEGLGSFERTDQEDVFLGVLNASLSMFTIFRMEMRLDKEVDGLFSKFQKGMNLLKKDDRLFQGLLYMSVKDINTNDGKGVVSEFKSKMQKLLTVNSGRNFLDEMYSGKVCINCSPPLGTAGYYTSLCRAKQLVKDIISAQTDSQFAYRSGEAFHDCIRLVLAKIATLDWTTVDETSQQLQMKNLYRKLPGVIRTGCLIPVECYTKESVAKCLMEPVVNSESEKALLRFDVLVQDHPEWQQKWRYANRASFDADCTFFDELEEYDFSPLVCTQRSASSTNVFSTELIDVLLAELFEEYLGLSSKEAFESISEVDYTHFDLMLAYLVQRRKAKVALWVRQLLGEDRFKEEWVKIEHNYLVPFEALLQRCTQQCAQCQLQCMRSACHSYDTDHDCRTSHKCRCFCEFCIEIYDHESEVPHCVFKAGHEGNCNCGKGDHTCGGRCDLADASNCQISCELKTGHRGNHRCSVKQHICGKSCSATNCHGRCVSSVEFNHSVHKCSSNQCNYFCDMDGCKERCSSTNHFHHNPALGYIFAQENGLPFSLNLSNDAVAHMCSSSHACMGLCEENGICSRVVRVSASHFDGCYGGFDYNLKRMVKARNKCRIPLRPGQKHHDGLHSCGKGVYHQCTAQCEACEYYCDKFYGHAGKHSTSHGNMKNMHFIVQKDEKAIEWNERKYAPGENGIAEMCGLSCSTGGRGHVHYLKCSKTSRDCVYSGIDDQRRHCQTLLLPKPKYELDEVLHAEYWKTIGWEDPCQSATERATFEKCPYICESQEHKGKGKTPSGCDLPAWHRPVTKQPYLVDGTYTYINGHRFACSHASSGGILHHILVLDCSGSMRGQPWESLVTAVREYLRGRMSCGFYDDVVSVVTFGDEGRIEYEQVKISNAATRQINFHGGGTFYEKGLNQAQALISRTNDKIYQPVLIFFTDGRPANCKKPFKVARNIRKYAVFGLRVFVVGFGKVSIAGLKELARSLGGKVHEACSTDMLMETFRSISMSLGACAGLICSDKA